MLRDRHFMFGLAVTLCCGVTLAQYSSNMFLNGEYQNGIKANPSKLQAINPTSNIFLEHAIISRQASPFQGPTYLPPEEVLKCSAGKQCVLKGQCADGYFSNPAQKAQNCKLSTHTCCIYRPPSPPPPPPTTERPYDVCSNDYDCVPTRFCNNGEIDSAEYIQKAKSNRCYSPDICCRIPSTTLTDDGYILRTPEVKFNIPTTGRPYQSPSIPQQPSQPRQPPSPPRQPPSPPRQTPSPPRQPPSLPSQPPSPPRQTPSLPSQPPSPPRQPPSLPSQPPYPPRQPPSLPSQPPSPPRQPSSLPSQPPSPPRQPPSLPSQPPSPPRQPPSLPSQPTSPPRQPPSPLAPIQPHVPPTTPQREYLPPSTYPTASRPVTPRNEYIPPAPTTPARQAFTQTPYQLPSRAPLQPQPVPTPQNAYLPPSPAYPPPSDYHVTQPSNTVTQTITATPPRIPQPTPPQRGEDILSLPLDNRKHLSKCASALECTPANFCNSIGVITDQPVDVNSAEAAFRVPLTDCFLENGAPGKCCRDANYVDPWPINLAGVCATRNKNTKPQGIQDFDANFGEIPWQAMILKESTKTLLGGGAIIGDQIVLTTASVVKGVSPNDLKVKAGEWELGRDSEPLPVQIVGVKSIDIHPEYNPSTGSNDMAVLRLDKRIEFAQHIKPICVTNEDPKPEEKCITTGWGKQAIKIHEEGAILHVSNTISQSRADCGADETSVCSAVVHDPCLLDVGSALACGSGSSVMLKGIYAAENACGDGQIVRFSKADLKWVNGFFTLQNKDKLLKKRRV